MNKPRSAIWFAPADPWISSVKNALSEVGLFGLAKKEAVMIAEELVEKIETLWDDASDYARLTKFQSDVLRKSAILSEGSSLNNFPSKRRDGWNEQRR